MSYLLKQGKVNFVKKLGMSVIYFLITVSIIIAAVFLILFILSVKNGQYDDDYTPSVRMLFDDELKNKTKTKY